MYFSFCAPYLRLSECNGMSRIRRMHAEVHVIICKV